MPENNDAKKNESITEDDLEKMLEDGFKYKEKPKHRGFGKYERRGIYGGPDIKNE